MKCVKCKDNIPDNSLKCESCGLKYNTTPLDSFEIKNDVIKKYNGSNPVVVIPEGIKGIGVGAFANSKICIVTLPNSITRIGDRAFYNCENLGSVTLPNLVTTINTGTFANCSNLNSFTISNSVRIICDNAFAGCASLINIDVPNTVNSISKTAFSNVFVDKTKAKPRNITLPNLFKDMNFANCDDVTFNYK